MKYKKNQSIKLILIKNLKTVSLKKNAKPTPKQIPCVPLGRGWGKEERKQKNKQRKKERKPYFLLT